MHVGVFLYLTLSVAATKSLPHARGGVSLLFSSRKSGTQSSPCTWGCFCDKNTRLTGGHVFPMHVGVFPASRKEVERQQSLPHARGGVSHNVCPGVE